MPIVDRSFTYRGSIGLTASDLALVRAGLKTCTIRLGMVQVSGRDVWLTDRRSKVRVEVTGVENRQFQDLDESDANDDGQPSLEALAVDLSRFYGAIEPGQPMTVIRFRIRGGD